MRTKTKTSGKADESLKRNSMRKFRAFIKNSLLLELMIRDLIIDSLVNIVVI
jgi:hypothetical protein